MVGYSHVVVDVQMVVVVCFAQSVLTSHPWWNCFEYLGVSVHNVYVNPHSSAEMTTSQASKFMSHILR